MTGWPRAAAILGAAVAVAATVASATGGSDLLWLVGLAFGVQWVAYVPAFVLRTERFYDLTGSLTYIAMVVLAVAQAEMVTARGAWMAGATLIWAARLGAFLAWRVHRAGSDGRFDELKQSAPRFLVAWSLQGLWCFLTPLLVWICLTTPVPGFHLLDVVGLMLWTGGFVLEVASDLQKSSFKAEPDNHGRFITTGWWAWSRHPNYAGEILLWAGVFVSAASQLQGWQWAAVVSPLFVYVLLRYISGVPMLEARAEERWGEDPDYLDYRARTPLLWPRPPA
jgi:steroid 5-alpha reductase family enzyme